MKKRRRQESPGKGATLDYKNRRRQDPPATGRPTLLFTILGLVILAAGLCIVSDYSYRRLRRSDFFQITAIRINGCEEISKERILELSGVDVHTNLLAVNPERIRKKVREHPWVAEAEVERKWPNRLLITVREKEPAAIINLSDGLWYLDRRGRPFAQVKPGQELDYPVISGLDEAPARNSRTAAPLATALQILRYAGRGNTVLPEQNISEIRVEREGKLVLHLLDRPFPIHLGKVEDPAETYHRLVKVLDNLYRSREFADTAVIRMDYMPDAVLVAKTRDTVSDHRHRTFGRSARLAYTGYAAPVRLSKSVTPWRDDRVPAGWQ